MAKMRNIVSAAGLAAAASVALSTGALADDDRKFGYTLTIAGTSDYLFRGVSFTNTDPAFQPAIEFTYGIGYVGLWFSNVKNGLGDPWEMDVTAGIRPVTGCINWDIGVIYYTNPDSKFAADTDYVEFKVGATTTFDKLTVGLTGYATPDQGLATATTETIEGSLAYSLPKMWVFDPTVSGLIGYTHAEKTGTYPTGQIFDAFTFPGASPGVQDYTYWNAGVKLAVDKFFMDFRYWDTDISHANDPNNLAQAKFVFSAGVTLP